MPPIQEPPLEMSARVGPPGGGGRCWDGRGSSGGDQHPLSESPGEPHMYFKNFCQKCLFKTPYMKRKKRNTVYIHKYVFIQKGENETQYTKRKKRNTVYKKEKTKHRIRKGKNETLYTKRKNETQYTKRKNETPYKRKRKKTNNLYKKEKN